KDYEHFNIPVLSTIDKVFAKVRNLRYRYMPSQLTLFPIETDQYDNWLVREVLHNCIAHQNYELGGRIYVNELDDKLLFTNEGSFIPGSVENVLKDYYSPPYYRNPFLVEAMVNLNLIDTVTSGIKEIYRILKKRFFPLPDYDLSESSRVKVTIYGKILDENYTKLLYQDEALDMDTIFLLDKVQKGLQISKEQALVLKKNKLIEGRYPNIYVSFKVAEITDEKAKYIKNKGLDDAYYKQLIIELLKKSKSSTKKEIIELLISKLPDVLTEKQKVDKVKNLLHVMKYKDFTINTIGDNNRNVKWILKNDWLK
ncbi:MAG: ATP-binding protein, partial [Ignavibacteria bacterium]|nr:ATP-binding protein [Ignavibacteria bacterium]